MKTIYVVGGQQRTGHSEWHGYRKAVIGRLDPESGEMTPCCEHVSPPDVCRNGDSDFVFKAGTIHDGKLHVCTTTELITYQLPEFEQVGYCSHPCFNDVHHVRPTARGTLLVANTGLDMVLEVSPDGEIVHEWDALGKALWRRFSRDVDYRKVASTKPHESHPNYVFEVGDDIWVTRFEQKDAVCLTNLESCIPIGVERPHDGIVFDDQVFSRPSTVTLWLPA